MRQFIASALPDKKGCVLLTEKERRYLISVLRKKNGDEIDVRLPNGELCTMCIQIETSGVKKTDEVRLSFIENISNKECKKNDSNVESGCDYWLFQMLPKGHKMDLIVRQATECGVSVIVPIIGEYSVIGKKNEYIKESAHKVERWMRIVREAQQQSGSSVNTTILSPCTLETAMTLWHDGIKRDEKNSVAFVLREKQEEQNSVFAYTQNIENFSNVRIGFVIGCEGGISPNEIDVLNTNNFNSIHLRTNILRAETASLYSIAVLQTVIEEYNAWKGLKE